MNGFFAQRRNVFRTRTLACLLLLSVATVVGMATEAQAEHWMYRRSYYSHQLPPEIQSQYPLPLSRTAYRPTFMRSGPGYNVRGGYRIKRFFLRSGNSTDMTIYREDWFEARP